MPIELMGYSPELVTIEGEGDDDLVAEVMGGESEDVAELLGIDYDDADLITSGNLSGEDIDYLSEKYPELMGFWAALARVGKKIGKGALSIGKRIAARVRERRAKRKGKSAQVEQARQVQAAQVVAQQQDANRNKMLMVGLPIAAIAAFLLLRK